MRFRDFLCNDDALIRPELISPGQSGPEGTFADWEDVVLEFLGRLDHVKQKEQTLLVAGGTEIQRVLLGAQLEVLRTKMDLCRAWLLALAPFREVSNDVGLPLSGAVLPLCFAVEVPAEKWARCSTLTKEDTETLVKASRVGSNMTTRIDTWATVVRRVRGWS
jgi:hypothetical protein